MRCRARDRVVFSAPLNVGQEFGNDISVPIRGYLSNVVAVGELTEIIGLKNLLVIAIKIRNVGCEPLDEFFHMSVEYIAVKDKIIKKLCTCVGFIRKGECIFENGTLARRKCHTAHTGTRFNSAAAECHIAVTKIRLIKAETGVAFMVMSILSSLLLVTVIMLAAISSLVTNFFSSTLTPEGKGL